jgi:hypothetical protein
VAEVWVGVDAGKTDHHCCVVDADGRQVLSRRVPNGRCWLSELSPDEVQERAWGRDGARQVPGVDQQLEAAHGVGGVLDRYRAQWAAGEPGGGLLRVAEHRVQVVTAVLKRRLPSTSASDRRILPS